ncbi:MAG: shikimate dehydrogenase [Candidatus Tantalella remota]|nr:shikimate dehydrogenase [Candidatus Tantalella remota]
MHSETGVKKKYGLLGNGISYSLSPVIHNAAFAHFGINAEYGIFDVPEDELDEFCRDNVLNGKISGFNITVPHKVKIKEMLDNDDFSSLEEFAEKLGAVNTVKVEEEGFRGYNTDGRGFYESLTIDAGFDPKDKTVLILGAGGAARAISFYLADEEKPVGDIFVFDVDGEKAVSLEKDIVRQIGPGRLSVVEDKDIPETIAKADLLVNATPMGTHKGDPLPGPEDMSLLLRDGMMVYDLVYCRETELVKLCRKKGIKAEMGLGMLINQAALAFDIWAEDNFCLGDVKTIMKKAALEELDKRKGAGE